MPEKKAVLLRIPPDLWESLNVWARDELRSLNAQIEYVLREATRKRKGQKESPTQKRPPDTGPQAINGTENQNRGAGEGPGATPA